MKPKRIILVRHGQSEANVDSAVYSRVPDWQIALTKTGVAQAQKAGRQIAGLIGDESFGLFVSPYKRTLQTKEALLVGIGRSPEFDYQDPELREQEYGNMPPKYMRDANRAFRREFGYFFFRFPDGESCADIYDRMALFIDSLHRRFNRPGCPKNIIIVSHSTAIKCFLARWYHWNVEYFDSLSSLPNCHVSVIEVNEGKGTSGQYRLLEPFEKTKHFKEENIR